MAEKERVLRRKWVESVSGIEDGVVVAYAVEQLSVQFAGSTGSLSCYSYPLFALGLG